MTHRVQVAQNSKRNMHELVRGQLVRAWYGAPGHEWTTDGGLDVTSQVRDLASSRESITDYDLKFGDPARGVKKTLVVESSDRVLGLRDWFQEKYLEGWPFTVTGYERIPGEECYHHVASGVKVWQDCLDLSQGSPNIIALFHYTDFIGFKNITAPEKQAAEIWASLYTHDDGVHAANAWYGKGAYASVKGPDDFHAEYSQNPKFFEPFKIRSTADLIVDNNFRNMALRDGFSVYQPKVKFCVPLIVRQEDSYDVGTQQTPEMAALGVPPNHNLKGNRMNEPGQPQRDQWVIRVEGEGTVQNARAGIVDVLRRRARRGDLMSLSRLGAVLSARGEFREAAAQYEKVYEARKRLHFHEHPNVLSAQSNYAYSLFQLDRFAEAEPIQKDHYQRYRARFGPDSRSTLLSLGRWADTLMHLGRAETAEPLFREAYDRSKKAFGESDLDTVRILGGWSRCLKEVGKEDQALQLRKKHWEERKKQLGPHHPDTLTALGNYGVSLSQAGRDAEAEAKKKQHYDACASLLGEKHPDTLTSMGNWAESLRRLGRTEEALRYIQLRYDLSREVMGPAHDSTLVAKTNLAVALGHGSPQYEPLLRQVYEARRDALGEGHPRTQRSKKNWQTAFPKRSAPSPPANP